MAWAEKLPSGGWRGGYRLPDGRKKYVSDQGRAFRRKVDARDAATEAEVKARRQAAAEDGTLSARTTWGEWWDLCASRNQSSSDTASTEHYIVEKYLRPQWGDIPLNKITHKAVRSWIADVSEGKSPSYTRRIWAVFSASISRAVKEEVLTASPCVGVTLPKLRKRAKPYMDNNHTAALGKKLHQQYQDMVVVALETGLRPGELCGLHAHRLDLDGGWLDVVEVFVSRQKVIRPYPKDEDARAVPLSMRAIEVLRRQLVGRDVTTSCGLPHTDGSICRNVLVFLSATGLPVNPRNYAERLRHAAVQAKVPHRSPYAGRRGFATKAADGGLDAFALAEVMGHSDISQTQEYVQRTPAARARLLAALGERPPLAAVDGARGAADGADLDSERLKETGKRVAES
ncbi:MAG TPA: tyrosine-type recombinase/integrase [Aeromicrobium sp.]|nr:tyrosine-type recombinase/integrase [Aeromicrobium sp.]HKY58740.1 tyrosine-type recombinase/integrase [Aeromicrobium sp.]